MTPKHQGENEALVQVHQTGAVVIRGVPSRSLARSLALAARKLIPTEGGAAVVLCVSHRLDSVPVSHGSIFASHLYEPLAHWVRHKRDGGIPEADARRREARIFCGLSAQV